jgi:hypothetical protein
MRPGDGIDHDASQDLPWGWWMRTADMPNKGVVIVDEHGQHWSSLRHAFWSGRLRMGNDSPRLVDEMCEIILAILTCKAAGTVPPGEIVLDLYRANNAAARYHVYWLQAEALLQPGGTLEAGVTPEGASVARMLLVTRSPDLAKMPVGPAAIAAFGPPGSSTECDRARFEEPSGPSATFPFAIVRETRGYRHQVAMLHRDPEDVVPLARTIWSVTCPDVTTRDRLYRWLYGRMHRWSAWGKIAQEHGAQALSQHLVALVMQDPAVARGTAEPASEDLPADTPQLR